jgi:hypothetical protein
MGLLPQVSGFTFVVNPSTAMICTGSPFFTNESLVALQYSPSAKTFPPLASIGVSAFTVFPAIVSLPTLTGRSALAMTRRFLSQVLAEKPRASRRYFSGAGTSTAKGQP